jgi:hypothetical protein
VKSLLNRALIKVLNLLNLLHVAALFAGSKKAGTASPPSLLGVLR